jgi:hypothetical protein
VTPTSQLFRLDPRVHVFFLHPLEPKTWMPTDQVRGLKAHGSSQAKGKRGLR